MPSAPTSLSDSLTSPIEGLDDGFYFFHVLCVLKYEQNSHTQDTNFPFRFRLIANVGISYCINKKLLFSASYRNEQNETFPASRHFWIIGFF